MTRVAALTLGMILLATASAPALAWHGGGGHVRFGIVIGAPFYPWYYPPYYPYYYPPAVVTVPASPPTYVEQGGASVAPGQQQGYWYYCAASKTYYPYVKDCPGGWQQVVPQPPR